MADGIPVEHNRRATDDPSARTIAALEREIFHIRELLTARIDSLDAQVRCVGEESQQRTDALDRVTDAKFVTFRTLVEAAATQVALALAASDKAVSKAEVANDKRFEAMNGLRSQMAEQQNHFMPRAESLAMHAASASKLEAAVGQAGAAITELKERQDRNEGRSSGFSSSGSLVFAVIGAVAAVVTIATTLIIATR